MKLRYPLVALALSASCLVASSQKALDATMKKTATPAARTQLEAWRKSTAAPPSGKGCYKIDYPAKVWQGISCGPIPVEAPSTARILHKPGPHQAITPNVSLLQGDWTMMPANPITSATGSIATLNNVTSVQSIDANGGPPASGLFTLQINSNADLSATSGSPSCSTSNNKSTAPDTRCRGWLQFVYSSNRQLYIQEWFINFLTSSSDDCPSGLPRNSKGNPSNAGLDCGANVGFANFPDAPNDFSQMESTSLVGKVLPNGTISATLNAGNSSYAVTGTDLVGAGSSWTSAEFNVFGGGTYGKTAYNMVQLNQGAQVSMALTSDDDSSGKQPTCYSSSNTAETSNMFLGPCVTTTTPGIFFNESPTVPEISLNPSQGPAAGGASVQVLGGPFNQPFQLQFGNQLASSINTLPDNVTVLSPAGSAGVPVLVTAAYIFPNGIPGPSSSPAEYAYFGTPNCAFSTYCPFYENQPPSFTASCTGLADFYQTGNIHMPSDFDVLQLDTTSQTGSTTGEALSLAACQVGSKTSCNFYSISTSAWCWSHSPPPPPTGCKTNTCGFGQKCCADPDGNGGTICIASNLSCPVRR